MRTKLQFEPLNSQDLALVHSGAMRLLSTSVFHDRNHILDPSQKVSTAIDCSLEVLLECKAVIKEANQDLGKEN